MILLLLQIIYVAIGLFWLTVFCFRESIIAMPRNSLAVAEQFFQTKAGRTFTQVNLNFPANSGPDSAALYSNYQIWGLIPGILGTTLFASITCGYLDQFAVGWLQTWYMQLILVSGGMGLLVSAALATIAKRSFTMKLLFADLLFICIVVQMNIVHFLWLGWRIL